MKIAIIAATPILAAAMQNVLAANAPEGTEFEVVKKLSDRSPGSEIASLGMPAFIPGGKPVVVHSLSAKMLDNATPEQRKAQWEILRSERSKQEDVAKELSTNVQSFTVIPAAARTEIRTNAQDVRLNASEAETVEEQLAIYKAGFLKLLASI